MIEGIYSPLDEAKWRVVHDFPGGAVRLAPLAGMRPGTLSNKVNPEIDTHHLTVDEAVVIQSVARDYRILYAEAMVLGHTCIPLGDFAGISDIELLNAYAKWHAEIGETSAAIHRALADRRVTRTEFAEIRREVFEDIQRAFEFLSRLEALIDG